MNMSTEDLVTGLRLMAEDMQSPYGVAKLLQASNGRVEGFVVEAADRMTLLANLASRHVKDMEEANERIKRLEEAGDLMVQHFYTDEPRSEMWEKAKEAKP
jgi:hypothetical protein